MAGDGEQPAAGGYLRSSWLRTRSSNVLLVRSTSRAARPRTRQPPASNATRGSRRTAATFAVNASVEVTSARSASRYGVTAQARGKPSLPTNAKTPTDAASSAATASDFA